VEGRTPFEQIRDLGRRGVVWVISVVWVSDEAFGRKRGLTA
jgi:hypothetical protein